MSTQRSKSFIPDSLLNAHTLCFLNHDILVQLLRSGEKQDAFRYRLRLNGEDDRLKLGTADNIFDWLETTGRIKERTEVLRTVVFPALLSDYLHFMYEALDTSKKAKLTVTYSLLRKPLQEALYLFETMLTDLDLFGKLIIENPAELHSQSAGGLDIHIKRISKVLDILGETDRFDAEYLSQLRYDKNANDGFDGICNKAIHLFTSHHAIRTEPLNINFIFSDLDAKLTQWQYLYSRLPYLLTYSRMVVEKLCSTFSKTWPEYLEDMERRVSAGVLLWAPSISKEYMNTAITKFVETTRLRLRQHCKASGFREPTLKDLWRMRSKGTFPGESSLRIWIRTRTYSMITRMQHLD